MSNQPSLNIPNFTDINLSNFENQLDTVLTKNLSKIDALLKKNTTYTWENFMQPIENLNDDLDQLWSPISHLNNVCNSDEIRTLINNCLPKLSDYHTALAHNKAYFDAVESIYQSDTFKTLTEAQQKTITHDIRDFKLAGVHLPPEKKIVFAKLSKELSQLAQKFEENVLDATMAWKKHITHEADLKGLPESVIATAKTTAEQAEMKGWLLTLDAPIFIAVMTFSENRALRKDFYTAFTTRASDQGPNAGKFDNSKIMQDILEKRQQLAKLLNFDNYAQYSLATKMVASTDETLEFLELLANKSHPAALTEYAHLEEFAKDVLNLSPLNAWDVSFASEKLRQQNYALSQEDLRPYFPEDKVVTGLFDIIQKLYGITVKPITDAKLWHKDAKAYGLYDDNNTLCAGLLLDLYARENKRGGAWMDDCVGRRRLDDGTIQLPIAYLTCNFNGPTSNKPALFTHDDVVTLFHECGHALQHVLTKIDVGSVAGISGIPWDAVEVASQFFENWAWEKEGLNYITEHYQTKAPLPDDLYQRMQKAKNFHCAMQMVRQLEFALFDFRLHMATETTEENLIQKTLDETRKQVAVVPIPDFNRFQHGFSHIFAGGYAAGYYSYKWAEVMACDAFSAFQKNGIFDPKTSHKFKTTFLESGGAKEPMDVFIEFMGRKPMVDALLEQSGIQSEDIA